ncbi:MAG TPA: PAS domain S-box protein [Longimicrobium sp.]|nr:PAS domain S-box protein [Longimicrobium sp.]
MDAPLRPPEHAAPPPGADDLGYRALFERLPVGVYRSTPDGRMVEANPALVRLAGYPSREAYLAAPMDALWAHPEDRLRWQALMERDGGVKDFEYLHRRTDGTLFWVRETARTLYDEAGRAVGYEGVLEDVTEGKAAEDRVRFQVAVLEGMRESVTAAGLDGSITYWNQAAEEMFGWSAEEVMGKNVLDVCPAPAFRDRAAAIVSGIPGGGRYSGEFQARRRSGEVFPILLSVSPVQDGAGRIIGCVGLVSDLTAQKREEAFQRFLAEAGTVLASALQVEDTLASVARMAVPALADWCFVDLVAEDGTLQRVATAHVDPEKDALGRELMRWPQCPDGPTVSARVLRSGQPWCVEEISDASIVSMTAHPEHLRILRRMELLSGVAVPLVARGRTLGVLRMATGRGGRRYGPDDVRLAEELARRVAIAVDNARLYQEVQRALRAREQVLHVVSHDLRNPLGAVVAHADMLIAAADAPAEARREWAGIIRRAGERMTRMIRDLLDASNLQLGRLSIEPAPVCPRALAAEAAQMLRPLAAAREVELLCEVSDDLPAVSADPERVVQVLSNLLGNALKHTPRGGRIRLRAAYAAGEARFSVLDTGPGVGADDLERVFEPFWRGPRATREGLGLGLSIARGLVEAHGGRIWAENLPGGGAAFHFTLPALPAAAGTRAA